MLFASFSVAAVAAQESVLVLEGGTLIDGRGGAPIENALVVVRGDRISAVGRRGQVPVPAGATVMAWVAEHWVNPVPRPDEFREEMTTRTPATDRTK